MRTSLPRELEPLALAPRRDMAIVDIREPEEREVMGMIPGAYPFPVARLSRQPWRLMAVIPASRPIALACMSGRRSLEALEVTRDVGFSEVCSLKGGLLGWADAGLPLAGLRAPSEPPPASLAALEQELVSCFAAERIEAILSADDAAAALQESPHQQVRDLLASLKAEGVAPAEALDEAISRLGLMAWTGGHPLPNIAANIDRMRGWLQQLAG